MKSHTTIEGLSQGIVGMEFIACMGQRITTFETDSFLILEQSFTTCSADTGIEQVEKAIEPVADFHNYCPKRMYFFRGTIVLG